jgi:hypothetical protein
MYVKTYTLPQHLQDKLRLVGYGKKEINIEPALTVNVMDYGADGHRSFFFPFSLATGCGNAVYGSWGGPNPFQTRQPDIDNRDHAIPEGCGICRGSEGGTGPTRASIYIHPASFAPLLPAVPSLDARQRSILKQYKELTSAGRKYEYDYNPASKPTPTELDSLVSAGFLSRNKAGSTAITMDGKNALMQK